MKLYGLMVAQNEGDIISDTLLFLRRLNVFEKIFFFDLGSEDDTLAKAREFGDLLHEPQSLDRVYTEGLRFDLLVTQQAFFTDGDWLAIVDADEMYAEDPRPIIETAEREHATSIRTYQCEFMLTDRDLASLDKEDPTRSIRDRRRHYLIQWSEDRFFKFMPAAGLLSSSRPCSRKLLNRHYQYRTPAQIELRIRTRLANKLKARHLPSRQTWPQIFSTHWEDYVIAHRLLHYDAGGELRFGLPDEVQWRDYYSPNPFSTIFPQIALVLQRDRSRTLGPTCAESDTSGPGPGGPCAGHDGILRDDYRSRVIHELTLHVRAGRWTEGLRTAVVLLRYLVRWCRRTLLPAAHCVIGRMEERLRSGITGLRRRFLGRTTGAIRASPNPIIRPQLSWQGVTTVTWRARADQVEVRVGAPDGVLFSGESPSGRAATGPWVAHSTVFYLQDVSGGRPLTPEHTLAKVTVGLVHGAYVQP